MREKIDLLLKLNTVPLIYKQYLYEYEQYRHKLNVSQVPVALERLAHGLSLSNSYRNTHPATFDSR